MLWPILRENMVFVWCPLLWEETLSFTLICPYVYQMNFKSIIGLLLFIETLIGFPSAEFLSQDLMASCTVSPFFQVCHLSTACLLRPWLNFPVCERFLTSLCWIDLIFSLKHIQGELYCFSMFQFRHMYTPSLLWQWHACPMYLSAYRISIILWDQ